jgi:hypothetical protein
VRKLKETKIHSSSLLINGHLHPPTILVPAAPWESREKREINLDFNALLIPL